MSEVVEIKSVDEFVLVCGVELTTRAAFDVVTELLIAIDTSRAFGEWKRGQVPEVDRHKGRRARP